MSSFKFLRDFKRVITSREWLMLIYNKSPNWFRLSKFSRTLSIFKSPLSSLPFPQCIFQTFTLSSSSPAHKLILCRANLLFQANNKIYQKGSMSSSIVSHPIKIILDFSFPIAEGLHLRLSPVEGICKELILNLRQYQHTVNLLLILWLAIYIGHKWAI